ncbi:polyketide synthase dehydratase domain-containing protein [Brevibacillus laterosporus]|nr:polyketide synthase dehydratase domain-containing protein [Brevibacillus laterosporus]MED1664475.1 polyketide synthase dehydratase domain-containing protein [Brevibacillus laterosporus]MED1671175.1 polyketide synthase dehydratase domain-containing protein [Brevibacillus laterosporus]MED1718007.1 polyketide synthase dehydratase domain-containing protein [Brevibacillus laterosporus]
MARELASRYYEGNIELTDVVFLTPIVVKENEDREIHFLVQKEKEYLKLTVTSQDYEEDGTPKDSWTIHTQVKIAPLSQPNHTTQSDMFSYATVAEMANYIDSKRGIPA